MKRSVGGNIWLVDLAGGMALACLLAASGWLGLVRGRETVADLKGAAAEVASRRRDLASLQSVATRQRTTLAEKEKQLAQSGRLPHETPTEEYFEFLSMLAAQHQLRILKHNPMPSQEYPGLREDRFAFDVVGTFPNLVLFFQGIESSPYWADVSYLRVSSTAPDGGGQTAPSAVANLTVSLFSAPPEKQKGEPG
jgi:hypothetical protein